MHIVIRATNWFNWTFQLQDQLLHAYGFELIDDRYNNQDETKKSVY